MLTNADRCWVLGEAGEEQLDSSASAAHPKRPVPTELLACDFLRAFTQECLQLVAFPTVAFH